MSLFLTALVTVSVMLLYAVPGFILIKVKFINESAISAFAKVLMYVCQPCLTAYSFLKVDFTKQLAIDLLFVFLFVLVTLTAIMLIFRFVFRKKQDDVRYRIYNIAICFSNCAFLGIPILESLLPEYPEAVPLSAAFGLAMNLIGFTLASAIIANDKKYIKPIKVLLNPATIALIVVAPLCITGTKLPTQIDEAITILAKMTTPLCMLIMGMRLACTSLVNIINKPSQYLIVVIKQMILPLLVWATLFLFPVDINLKMSLYIMFCCPIASVVLNFSEMIGEGQDIAAHMTLLGTGLSIVTIPIMVLIL